MYEIPITLQLEFAADFFNDGRLMAVRISIPPAQDRIRFSDGFGDILSRGAAADLNALVDERLRSSQMLHIGNFVPTALVTNMLKEWMESCMENRDGVWYSVVRKSDANTLSERISLSLK